MTIPQRPSDPSLGPAHKPRRRPGPRRTPRRGAIASTLLFLIAISITACAPRPNTTRIDINPADYARTFDAARDALRDRGFELDRVDARAGIITTATRASAGYATPWIDHTTTIADATNATIHPDRRAAVIRFQPLSSPLATTPASAPPTFSPPPIDLRTIDTPIVATVDVIVYRLRRPGRQLDPTATRLASWSIDPAAPTPAALVQTDNDNALAAEITAAIATRLNRLLTPPIEQTRPAPSTHEPTQLDSESD